MLSGQRERWKNSNRSRSTLHVQHTFFCKFLLHDYNVKLPQTAWLHVLWRKSESSVFFHVAHFHPGGRKHFSFSHRHYKLSCCSSYKQSLLCFSLISCSSSFSRWASLACRPTFSFLYLPPSLYSKFVDNTINLSSVQHGYRNIFRFPFSSLLTL